jgi:hypothetical protein
MDVSGTYVSETGDSEPQLAETYEGPPSYTESGGAYAAPANTVVDWYSAVEPEVYSPSGVESELTAVTGVVFGWAYVIPSLAQCDYVPPSLNDSNSYDHIDSTTAAAGAWAEWQQLGGGPLR